MPLVNGICPLCHTSMDGPPRDWNICPNEACFVEFGLDTPHYTDDHVCNRCGVFHRYYWCADYTEYWKG